MNMIPNEKEIKNYYEKIIEKYIYEINMTMDNIYSKHNRNNYILKGQTIDDYKDKNRQFQKLSVHNKCKEIAEERRKINLYLLYKGKKDIYYYSLETERAYDSIRNLVRNENDFVIFITNLWKYLIDGVKYPEGVKIKGGIIDKIHRTIDDYRQYYAHIIQIKPRSHNPRRKQVNHHNKRYINDPIVVDQWDILQIKILDDAIMMLKEINRMVRKLFP